MLIIELVNNENTDTKKDEKQLEKLWNNKLNRVSGRGFGVGSWGEWT